MLEQLQTLQHTVSEIKSRYNITATELANLKLRTNDNGAQQINQLQSELRKANQEIANLLNSVNELSSSKAHLEAQMVELSTQNQLLEKENQALNDKLATALEHTQTLKKWLTSIDEQSI